MLALCIVLYSTTTASSNGRTQYNDIIKLLVSSSPPRVIVRMRPPSTSWRWRSPTIVHHGTPLHMWRRWSVEVMRWRHSAVVLLMTAIERRRRTTAMLRPVRTGRWRAVHPVWSIKVRRMLLLLLWTTIIPRRRTSTTTGSRTGSGPMAVPAWMRTARMSLRWRMPIKIGFLLPIATACSTTTIPLLPLMVSTMMRTSSLRMIWRMIIRMLL
mmetsp:Transcript_19985/g.56640  ORF Transcript_19985/g.56640 Transcript_19985/m.56640 type:complete len:212 (+) Transcript_19985:690-1325(+)